MLAVVADKYMFGISKRWSCVYSDHFRLQIQNVAIDWIERGSAVCPLQHHMFCAVCSCQKWYQDFAFWV